MGRYKLRLGDQRPPDAGSYHKWGIMGFRAVRLGYQRLFLRKGVINSSRILIIRSYESKLWH